LLVALCSSVEQIYIVGLLLTQGGETDKSLMRDQRVWSVKECAEIFCQSVAELQQRLQNSVSNSEEEDSAMLVWDKVIIICACYCCVLLNFYLPQSHILYNE